MKKINIKEGIIGVTVGMAVWFSGYFIGKLKEAERADKRPDVLDKK